MSHLSEVNVKVKMVGCLCQKIFVKHATFNI